MSAPISPVHLRQATQVVHDGGVIAYPTEGVYGLGCDPDQPEAVLRILKLKQRSVHAGLILIAMDRSQLDGWIDPSVEEEGVLAGAEAGITWVITADPQCPDWITGGRSTCAVRLTRHPVAVALCRAASMPLVSTSANRHGQPAATSRLTVRRRFGRGVDFIMPGALGSAGSASQIRVARTGTVLRIA